MELLTVIKCPASRGCGGARPNPSIIGGRSSCVSCTPLHPLCTVCTTIAPRVLHFSAVHITVSLVGFVNHMKIFIGLLSSMNLLTLGHCTGSAWATFDSFMCKQDTVAQRLFLVDTIPQSEKQCWLLALPHSDVGLRRLCSNCIIILFWNSSTCYCNRSIERSLHWWRQQRRSYPVIARWGEFDFGADLSKKEGFSSKRTLWLGTGPSLCSQYVPKSRRLGRLLWNAVLRRNCTHPPSLCFKFLT